MKFSQIIATTWENLMGNKMRTLLTVSGISIGIATIIFLVSLGYGLQEFSVKRVSSLDALSTLDVSQGKTASFKLDKSSIENISKIKYVEKVSPIISLGGKASYNDKKTDLVTTAVYDNFFNYEDVKIAEGGVFSNSEEKILISSALAKTLGADNKALIGQQLDLSVLLPKADKDAPPLKLKLTICGVVQDNSSTFAYISQNLIENELEDGTIYTALKVKLQSQDNLNQVKNEIEASGFSVSSVADTVSQISQVFAIVRIVLALFGGFALLVAAIGMFNTMTVALLERTRDIGIMKSIGVNNKDVYLMFLSEAVIISILGGMLGVGLGALISALINVIITGLANLVGAEPVTLFYTPLWFSMSVFAFSVLVGASTGFYPARRASKLNPLDALRYE
ncbi:MAG: Macrolide export ATP-binding/permease protein MacB [bacterium ADurb.Bin212]|nr:MAG: Macrolide export ATP-binding/permease protein MacB [bacterium ADurb.Bin212]